mmetsp:Transcript_5175/g.13897  ORF Transcript_5175/g.13897 Transcript_5175/m.13897 type:complete len:161 (-) Transcript_5175:1094-1576(-)
MGLVFLPQNLPIHRMLQEIPEHVDELLLIALIFTVALSIVTLLVMLLYPVVLWLLKKQRASSAYSQSFYEDLENPCSVSPSTIYKACSTKHSESLNPMSMYFELSETSRQQSFAADATDTELIHNKKSISMCALNDTPTADRDTVLLRTASAAQIYDRIV